MYSVVFTSTLQLICALLYMILIIYLIVQQIQLFRRLKRGYFRRFWSYIDLGIIVCSWSAIVTYLIQYREATRIGALFQKTNGFFYVNLQRAAYINDLQNAFLAFSCFFSCLNVLRLGQYHRRLRLFTDTLRRASKELLSFAVMFSVVFSRLSLPLLPSLRLDTLLMLDTLANSEHAVRDVTDEVRCPSNQRRPSLAWSGVLHSVRYCSCIHLYEHIHHHYQ